MNASLAPILGRLRSEPRATVEVGNLWGSSPALVAGLLAREQAASVLLIAPDELAAEDLAEDVRTLAGAATAVFPAVEASSPDSPRIAAERTRALAALERGAVIAASRCAALQPVPDPATLERALLALAPGDPLDLRRAAARLVDAGLERVPLVETPGQFAVRGGILDLFPLGAARPIRVELVGDEIESLRSFDPETQVSEETLADAHVLLASPRRVGEIALRASGPTILDFVREPAVVALLNPLEADPSTTEEDRARLARRARLLLSPLPAAGGVNLHIRSLQRFSGQLAQVPAELAALAREGVRIEIFCGTTGDEQRLREILREANVDAPVVYRPGRLHRGFLWEKAEERSPLGPASDALASLNPASASEPGAGGPGGATPRPIPEAVAYLPHHEIFRREALRRPSAPRTTRPVEAWADVEPGDIVVHVHHGIAVFRGFQTIRHEGAVREIALLEYADRTILHVPTSDLDLVEKYYGGTDRTPALSHLGTAGWVETTARAERAARELARDLLETQALRELGRGIRHPADAEWQRAFEASFPYEETDDQVEAAARVKSDMESDQPMDRLLCGDVGYGKTEIAMRAAFKAVTAGRQVAVLVPTTLLAQQHGHTFRERMADYPIAVEVLSRFRTRPEQEEVLDRLAKGEIDVVVGTHRLVQPDVKFRELGLVVIDEEQRFGVEHKERLKRLRANVDVLTLTATPIPRTLHMALLGLRNITSLMTPPQDRLAVRTTVDLYDDARVARAIRAERSRGGQVFFVHNRVETIEEVAAHLAELVPEAAVAIGHGQMDEERLERTMVDFLERRVDVLVSTTIIESGLDIPNVNTLIIYPADLLGLADMHQLRGRVGRTHRQAHAYFLMPRDRAITPAAWNRLKAIEEFSELGAGFKIAMRDLEIRGAGNLLGREQHGHIVAIGYDLYCRLLGREVKALRTGATPPELIDAQVDLRVEARIPEEYVPDLRVRVDVYRRIARARTADEFAAVRRELKDRFGPPPPAVEASVRLVEVRRAAEARKFTKVAEAPDHVQIEYLDEAEAGRFIADSGGRARRIEERRLGILKDGRPVLDLLAGCGLMPG